MEFALDLMNEDSAGPAVFGGLGGIPEAEGGVFEFFGESDVVSPRNCEKWLGGVPFFNFCNSLLQI